MGRLFHGTQPSGGRNLCLPDGLPIQDLGRSPKYRLIDPLYSCASKAGTCVEGDGRRLRLWGVNLPMQSNRPAKQDAAAYAAHLARFGVNCVRIHHFDWPAPVGIIARQPNSRTFDAEQLDRFDYFFAELKKRGIYVDLNLNVGRRFQKDDGVREY